MTDDVKFGENIWSRRVLKADYTLFSANHRFNSQLSW